MAFAAKALPEFESGILVVENHGNAGSLRHLRARRHRGERWFAELSHEEVEKLFARHGFEVTERRGFSMITPSLHDHSIARAADAALRRLPGANTYAVNVLYTARRA